MIRKLLFQVLPFLLPFMVYWLWLFFARRRGKGGGWRDAPWVWLVIAGIVLVLGTLVTVGLLTRSGTEGSYNPPHLEDGEIVPAGVD